MTDSTIGASTRYPVIVMKEGRWELKRSKGESEYYYQSMIFHVCSFTNTLRSMNGRDILFCTACKERIPDTIQAVWVLHNQRIYE